MGRGLALARHAPGTVLQEGAELDPVTALPIAALPLAALRLPMETASGLRALGFDTVGDVAAAPRASLTLRFGPGPAERLDALAGRRPELLEPVLSHDIPHVRLTFAEPLGHLRGLELALGRLAALLCADLERRGLGLRRADLRLHRIDGQVAVLRAMAALAMRDPAHLVRLFGERLATVDPGFGVEAAVLAATLTEPFAATQARVRLDGAEGEDAVVDLARLVDRLGARIGPRRVYRLAVVESDVPERGLVLVPALVAAAGRSWGTAPRPSRLFASPEPAEVVALLPDHPPAVVTWRGRRHRVVAADGPECVAGEWWLNDDEVALVRDYYRVEDADGRRLWLFRARTADAAARWFVHGVFA